MEFVAISIGHAGITLTRTLDHLTAAFSTVVRLSADHANTSIGTPPPIIDSITKSHDYRMFKSLLDALADLAQSRLLYIIRNMKRLVDSLPRAVNRQQAYSGATPSHTQAAAKKEAANHTHRTRTT